MAKPNVKLGEFALYSSFRNSSARATRSRSQPMGLVGRRRRAITPATRNVQAIAIPGAACHHEAW